MKKYLILILLALSIQAQAEVGSKKMWCLVFFKTDPHKKFLLESELIGVLDKKSPEDVELLTLKGRILENSKYKEVDTYIVKSTACTEDFEVAKTNLDVKNLNGREIALSETPKVNETQNQVIPETKPILKEEVKAPEVTPPEAESVAEIKSEKPEKVVSDKYKENPPLPKEISGGSFFDFGFKND